jgi:hypothetical protein
MSWVHGQPAVVDGAINLPEDPGFGAGIDESRLRLL